MKKRYFALALFLLVFLLPFFFAPPLAATPNCNGVDTSIDFNCSKNSTDGVSAILMYVINFMAVGVGIAVVIGIIFGGITYASSDGEEAKAKEGREIIANSIIGLFLFIFLYAGANFLLPGGVFNLNAKPAAVASSPSTTGGSSGTPASNNNNTTASTITAKSDKIYNFRDAGKSGAIKSGLLFRSAQLSSINNLSGKKKEETIAKLETLLKGGVVIDLRTTDERKEEGADPNLENVSHLNVPMSGKYDDFVTNDTTRKAIATALRTIAEADGPVLLHCHYGKDRTGWIVAMVMYASGATTSQVKTEYMSSNSSDRFPTAKDVKWSNMSSTIDAARSDYGTINNYLKEGLGLTDATLKALKEKFAN